MSPSHDSPLNPFDDDSLVFRVLVNAQGQYSLWPDFADLPGGWQCCFGPADRAQCLAHVDQHWTAINPFAPQA